MSSTPTLWERFLGALPWNRTRDARRKAFEEEVQSLAGEPGERATSAAEAMAAMKAESRAKRPVPTDEAEDVQSQGGALHERWRAGGREAPSAAEHDEIRRKRGG